MHAAKDCEFNTCMERQDLSRTYLAHHELESVVIIIIMGGPIVVVWRRCKVRCSTCHMADAIGSKI